MIKRGKNLFSSISYIDTDWLLQINIYWAFIFFFLLPSLLQNIRTLSCLFGEHGANGQSLCLLISIVIGYVMTGLHCNLVHFNEKYSKWFSSVQFNSVAQSWLTLCDPVNRSTPGIPAYHQLPEFTQIHVHWDSDAIQASHPLSSPFPPAPNPSQHQSLFQWVNSSHEVAKVLEFHL